MGKFRTLESYNNEGAIGSGTNPNVSQGFTMDRAQLTAILDLVGAQAPTDIEILSGAITPTGAFVVVDTEGQAPSDELQIINALRSAEDTIHDGVVLYLSAKDSARKVTLVNSASVNGIKTLSGANLELPVGEFIQFQLVDGAWIQRSRANATDEQLSSLSQSELEKLGINAFQFKQIKDPVDYATEHGQIGEEYPSVDETTSIYTLSDGTYTTATTLVDGPSVNANFGKLNVLGSDGSVCTFVFFDRLGQMHIHLYSTSPSVSSIPWKIISDGSQGMPSARRIANISVPIHLYSSSGEYDSSYIAPANGKVRSTLRYSGTLQEVRLLNVDTFETSGSTMGASAGGVGTFFASIDVKKGDRVVIACASTTTGFTIFSDFIYAEGN